MFDRVLKMPLFMVIVKLLHISLVSLRISKNNYCQTIFTIFPNTGKYGPEKSPYLGTFHVVLRWQFMT